MRRTSAHPSPHRFVGRRRRAQRRRGGRGLVRVAGEVLETERFTHHLPLPSRMSLLGIIDPFPNQSDERADRDESATSTKAMESAFPCGPQQRAPVDLCHTGPKVTSALTAIEILAAVTVCVRSATPQTGVPGPVSTKQIGRAGSPALHRATRCRDLVWSGLPIHMLVGGSSMAPSRVRGRGSG